MILVKCKHTFSIGQASQYEKDLWYECFKTIHKETGMDIYYVDNQPMLERTFKENFEDPQKIRNDKINELLNETDNGS